MLKIIPDNFDTHHAFCPLPYTKVILNSYGELSLCCHQTTQIGKLTPENSILDLWNSPIAREIRAETDKGNLHAICRSWNSCPYLTKPKIVIPFKTTKNLEYPLYLEICLPDKWCNIGGFKPTEENPACIMCKRNFNIPEQPDLTDFLCEKSLPLMPHLQTLCVLGTAEPFWKGKAFEILEKLEFAKHKHHIEFYTNTNGICLTEKVVEKFFQTTVFSNLAWSLDAATAITHQKIRRLDALDLIVKHLKNWLQVRKEYGGSHNHKVSIYNNINLLNVHEMVPMVEMAVELGVDWMTLLPTYNQSGLTPLGEILLNEKNLHIFREESERATQRAKELGLNLVYQNRFDIVPPSPEKARKLLNILK